MAFPRRIERSGETWCICNDEFNTASLVRLLGSIAAHPCSGGINTWRGVGCIT